MGLVAVLLSVFAAACGSSDDTTDSASSVSANPDEETTGVSDSKIRIGVLTALSGPVAAANGITQIAQKAVIDKVNGEGGVNGREIELVTADEGATPSSSAAALQKLISQEEVFALLGCISGVASQSHRPIIEQAKIPDFVVSCSYEGLYQPPSPWIFTTTTTNTLEGHAAYEAAKSTFQPEKIAVISEQSAYGELGTAAIEKLAEEDGIEVQSIGISATATSAKAQVAELRGANADAVIVDTLFQAGTVFLKEYCSSGIDAPAVNTVGTSADNVLEGLPSECLANKIVGTSNNKGAVGSPVMEPAVTLFETESGGRPPLSWELLGMGGAEVFVTALERAGKDLTRTKLRDALESLADVETQVFAGPVSFSPQKHIGNYSFIAFRFKPNGEAVQAGDTFEAPPVAVDVG